MYRDGSAIVPGIKYYGLSSVGQELFDPFKGILLYSVEFHFMQ
jgi:hypothetical protein